MPPCHVMTGAIGFQSGIPRAVAKNSINPLIHLPPERRGLISDKVKSGVVYGLPAP